MNTKIDQKKLIASIYKKAMAKHPHFWSQKKDRLNSFILELLTEISSFESSKFNPDSILKKDVKNILAFWCISGSGSLSKDLIASPSDNKFESKKWYSGTDRARLRFCEKTMLAIARLSPYLIYNGTTQQDKALLKQSGKNFAVPKDKIYIPKGEIIRTLDQIENFSMPPDLRRKTGELIIVSHAPHLARILRFMKMHKQKFKGLTIRPLAVPVDNSSDFVKAEVSGILDNVATGKASEEPIKYKN